MSQKDDDTDGREPPFDPNERVSRLSLDSLKARLSWMRKDREAFDQKSAQRLEDMRKEPKRRSPLWLLGLTAALVGLAVFLIWLFPPRIESLPMLDFGLDDDLDLSIDLPDAGPGAAVDAGFDAGRRRDRGGRRPTAGDTAEGDVPAPEEAPPAPVEDLLDLADTDDPLEGIDRAPAPAPRPPAEP